MNRLPAATTRYVDTMSRMAFFQNWPTESMERLAAGTKLVTAIKNERLAHKGENLEHLYVLVSGLVRLFIPLPNDMERVVALVSPGESLGEACLVLNELCPYHAVAGRDSHLLAIDAHLFRRELSRDQSIAQQTMEIIARRLMDSLRDTEICAQRSSVQRVACFLMQQQPVKDMISYKFSLPARKQDIAAKLGLTQETFSRMLGFLQKQGLIQVDGAHILVENGLKLAQISTLRETKEPCQP
jgi:CRP/FNR family transcriptional regulator, dissimilatory nitrate respiration regulator